MYTGRPKSMLQVGATGRLIVPLLLAASVFPAEDPPGALLYKKHCASCHESPDPLIRVPSTAGLKRMRAGSIFRVMQSGVMREQSKLLSRIEKQSISNFLGATEPMPTEPGKIANPCPPRRWHPESGAPAWANWGVRFENWRHHPEPGLAPEDVPRLKMKWAYGFQDAVTVRSQPAVYGGRLFAGSQYGALSALDASSGCTYWSTEVAAQVRSGLSIARVNGRTLAFLGDTGGNLYALDAATGAPVWQARPDAHPAAMITSTPVVHQGRVYFGVSSYEEGSALNPDYVCCGFRGSVAALDADTGRVIWKTYTIKEPAVARANTKRGKKAMGPSGAGVWSSPTLDPRRGVLYVTTGDNYSDPPTDTSDAVIALSMDRGRILWTRQMTKGDAFNSSCPHPEKYNCPDSDGPDFDLGASAMLVDLASGRRALILAQKSGMLHAVDPDRQGEILWQSRVGEGGVLGGIQWGPATDGSRIYVALSDIGFTRSYEEGSVRPVRTLDDKRGGGLFAFRPDNGERIWQTPAPPCAPKPCSPAQSAAISSIPGVVFSGSVDGHLRAYDSREGRIIWDFDTAREFRTVNGVPAAGGSMDVGGAVVAGGMVYVGSGYGQWGGIPGNVLLAFEVER